ncbi:MBL fold metallo-hydrolase [Lolliginicoccus suaedae]|uniref:MBL fold metallo-hydrolase n=1 Tax=Lolliginicoccus suaedae TaxID=2605429 RepID=UPI0011EBE31A|nr:MBL fold metallo-hydrolase [Lolliginicoccus suaedae]
MKQIEPDLWETGTEQPAPGLTTHAYLWTSPVGNILFYNTTHDHEIDHMARLGGVARHYLSHQDEIAPSLRTIRNRFGSTLHLHASEAHLAGLTVDDPFTTAHVVGSVLEVIPTPGHTPGSTCYLAHGASGKYLFTGDTVYLRNGSWAPGYIPGFSDRAALDKTLTELARLEPDIVISSAFVGDSGVMTLDRPWPECIEQARRALA